MTTFDEVYEMFSVVTSVDEYSLPLSDEGRYELINSARKLFNAQLFLRVQQDNTTETFDTELSDAQIVLFCHYMSYIIYKNMQSELASMISMANKDNALKDYKAQADSRKELAQQELEKIKQLKVALLVYTESE